MPQTGFLADIYDAQGSLLHEGVSVVDLRRFDAGRYFVRIYQVGTNALRAIDSISRSGAVATVSFPGHGLRAGQVVEILGANEAGFNGAFRVINVLDRDIFTLEVASTLPLQATGQLCLKRAFEIQILPPKAGQNRELYANTDRDFFVTGPETDQATTNSTARFGFVFDRALQDMVLDPGLRVAIAKALDIPLKSTAAGVPVFGVPVFASDLASLLWLDAGSPHTRTFQGISYPLTRLTGLEYAINLRVLNLSGHQIAMSGSLDSTPEPDFSDALFPLVPGIRGGIFGESMGGFDLQDLPKDITRTPRELDGQVGLAFLRQLTLDLPAGAANQVNAAALDELATLLRLEFLSLDGNRALETFDRKSSDNQPSNNRAGDSLAALEALKFLSFDLASPNDLSDLTPLNHLKQLRWLSLRQHSIASLRPLLGLTNLLQVDLEFNQIQELGPLAGEVLIDNEWILLNNDAAYHDTGWQRNLNPASNAFEGDYRYILPAMTAPFSTATWTLEGLPFGWYEVFVTFPDAENRATNAPYEVSGRSASDQTWIKLTDIPVRVNQSVAPAANAFAGRQSAVGTCGVEREGMVR